MPTVQAVNESLVLSRSPKNKGLQSLRGAIVTPVPFLFKDI